MTTLKRIDPSSAFKVFAIMYLVMGLIVGVIYACFALTGFSAMTAFIGSIESETGQAIPFDLGGLGVVGIILGLLCGVVFYAVIGGIIGAIVALVYNFTVQWTGGLQLELESEKPKNEPIV